MKKILLFLFFSCTISLFSQILPRWSDAPLTTSIIIPCAACHFKHLRPLLEAYQHQTLLPDEIAISLSEVDLLNSTDIDTLEKGPWPFALTIHRHSARRSAGANRNFACMKSKADLLICQDADDLPHPQRVEIVKYLFEHYQLDHLIHAWLPDTDEFTPYDPATIQMYHFRSVDALNNSPLILQRIRIHHGNVCVLRKLIRTLHWEDCLPADRDVQFNVDAYRRTSHTAVIFSELVKYRWSLSAYRPENAL
ncbi:MAG TPA: glycosyltransferase family A protein [Chlamydiales bacterium]|nr:glycosyltransferase family A protein [Chlamydiales bacterium]